MPNGTLYSFREDWRTKNFDFNIVAHILEDFFLYEVVLVHSKKLPRGNRLWVFDFDRGTDLMGKERDTTYLLTTYLYVIKILNSNTEINF